MRRLIVVALALVVLGVAGTPRPSAAQPGPPNRFYGSLTIDGAPAPVGTVVTAVMAGKDCGNRTTDTIGQYWVDAAGGSQIPGCGGSDPVQFRIGARFANESGSWQQGMFTQLNLTVTASVATATPPATTSFTLSRLDMSSPCIPATGAARCDDARLKLWNGDVTAWTAQETQAGRPPPDADQVFVLTYEYRIGANDPAAIASLARGLGWPKIYITAVRYKGSLGGEADEYIEVTNVGGLSQDMTGWRASAADTNTSFYFTDGSALDPGAVCRFYTGQVRDDSCPGTVNVSTSGVWNDGSGTAELWYDPLALLADGTRYSADPAAQPPPPNLQGAVAPAS